LTITTPACAAAFGPNPAGSIRLHPPTTPYHPQPPHPPPVGAVAGPTSLLRRPAVRMGSPAARRRTRRRFDQYPPGVQQEHLQGRPPSPAPGLATPNFVIRFSVVSFSSSSCRLVRGNSL
jgi:hypothetical protein